AAAQLAERERLAARIHDDVLQNLARLRARMADLSGGPAFEAVAQGIARQESALRRLARFDPDPAPAGRVSLRDRLAELADGCPELPVRLVAVAPVRLPAGVVAEIAAAVAELLTNVVKHAQAQRIWLTMTRDRSGVTVSVRDDGVGFELEQGTCG